MDKLKISMSIEKSVHDAMREIAQSIWDKFGIRIDSVRFSWVDASTPGRHRFIVDDVNADTTTKSLGVRSK